MIFATQLYLSALFGSAVMQAGAGAFASFAASFVVPLGVGAIVKVKK